MSNRRLIIVRHGRTTHNADGRFQGHLDTQLDAFGREQAAACAGELASFTPLRIISSDSARAADTAAPLAALTGQPVVIDERLREVDMGAWTGLTHTEAEAAFPEQYADWLAGVDTARGGGETFKAVAERAVAAVTEHLREVPADGVLVAFTHGGTARALTGFLLELPWEWWWRLRALDNARRTVLVEARRGWRLSEFNSGC